MQDTDGSEDEEVTPGDSAEPSGGTSPSPRGAPGSSSGTQRPLEAVAKKVTFGGLCGPCPYCQGSCTRHGGVEPIPFDDDAEYCSHTVGGDVHQWHKGGFHCCIEGGETASSSSSSSSSRPPTKFGFGTLHKEGEAEEEVEEASLEEETEAGIVAAPLDLFTTT